MWITLTNNNMKKYTKLFLITVFATVTVVLWGSFIPELCAISILTGILTVAMIADLLESI